MGKIVPKMANDRLQFQALVLCEAVPLYPHCDIGHNLYNAELLNNF